MGDYILLGNGLYESYGSAMLFLGIILGLIVAVVIAAFAKSKTQKISKLDALEIKQKEAEVETEIVRLKAVTDYERRHYALGSGHISNIAKKDGVELIFPEEAAEENSEASVRARNKELTNPE